METKWYYKPYMLVFAFLCVGPLALPLVWFNPTLNRKKKLIISIVIIVISYFLMICFVGALKSIKSYYQQMLELM